MRIAIAFDDVDARDATADERAVLDSVDAVEGALRRLGHEPVHVPVGGEALAWMRRLRACDAALVFNLCEGIGGRSALEPHFAAAVELLGLPFTGNTAETLALARRKDRVNAILAAAGIGVPAWALVANGSPVAWSDYPVIVKPAGEDASVGIDRESVARSLPALQAALARAHRWAPLLVQSFVDGRELNIAFVGEESLPISEIVFEPDDSTPIVDYRAKWVCGSKEDRATRPCCPARLDAADAEHALGTARAAWRALGGRGYGRVDVRLDRAGVPWVIDINPNPDLGPGAGLARSAQAAGWTYDDLVARVLAEAA